MKILVLGGGTSQERDVSVRSAKAVATAARRAGFEVQEADPSEEPRVFDGLLGDTIIFPILHGAYGEDGEVQKELENLQLPYLGSDSKSSANCFDKWLTRQKLIEAGIPMPPAVLVSRDTYDKQLLSEKAHVLKVQRGGSSIGTIIQLEHKKIDDEQLDKLFGLDHNALLEEYIDGIEVTVPILDQRALPVIEIVPPVGELFDYDNKYNGRTQELSPPPHVPRELQQKVQWLAEQAHKTMGCRHLSRVDIIIDNEQNPQVLEINTMPGLTDESLYPKAAAVADMTMPQLVANFAGLVKRDYNL